MRNALRAAIVFAVVLPAEPRTRLRTSKPRIACFCCGNKRLKQRYGLGAPESGSVSTDTE
jgi:hypothetical protein